jgi:hypothetical protein
MEVFSLLHFTALYILYHIQTVRTGCDAIFAVDNNTYLGEGRNKAMPKRTRNVTEFGTTLL